VWDVSSGERRKTLAGAKGVVRGVAASPDGKRVAASCSGGLVLVWDATSGQNVWTRSEPGPDAMSVNFSPDGKSLAVGYGRYSGSQVGRVKVWDVASGREIKASPGPRGGVNSVAFHPDGKRLAVAGSEVVEIWDLEGTRKLHDLGGHKKWVYCLAYSPDGKWLATGGWDNTVKLWDAATGVVRLTIFAHDGFVQSVAFSPDSRSLATSSDDRSTRLWEVPSGRRLATFHGHTDFVQTVAFRPDGSEVATGSADGSIRFWSLRTSRPVVVAHTGWVERLAFRRDGLRVLSEAGNYRTDALPTLGWNPFTGELDATLTGVRFESLPADYVRGPLGYAERFQKGRFDLTSPDGRRIAQIGAGDASQAARSKEYSASSVVVRDARTAEILHTLTGHSMDVVAMAFSPDGRRLATASFDRTVKLWDMETGQEVLTLRGHTAGVVSVAFGPDGNQIVTGGIDFTARVWNATPVTSSLTAEHDARYRKKIETLEQLKATTDDVRRAEILAGSGQWSMASAALARAVEKEPGKLPLRYMLIDALLQSGDTSRIGSACDAMLKQFGSTDGPLQARNVADFCRLARLAVTAPEKRQAVHDMALPLGEARPAADRTLLSLVESGDLAAYRAAAGKLLARFRKASDPNTLNNAAWLCIYAPDAVADLTLPVLMAEAALAGYPGAQKRYALNTLGAALYRAGRVDEAIARLDESVKASGGGVPQDWVFLAMAHRKKGHAEEARRWLEKTRAAVKPDPEVPILLREAEALLNQATAPARRRDRS
jgi:WD40 repeat protein